MAWRGVQLDLADQPVLRPALADRAARRPSASAPSPRSDRTASPPHPTRMHRSAGVNKRKLTVAGCCATKMHVIVERRRGRGPRDRLDNWCAPVIYYWCAPVEERRTRKAPAGGTPLRPRASNLGVAMRLHGTAMPAGRDPAQDPAGPAMARGQVPGDNAAGPAAPRGWRSDGAVDERAAGPGSRVGSGSGPIGRGGPGPGTGRMRQDRPARWLTASMLALGVLAGAAAVVSFSAQYRMVFAAKDVAPVAALEAGDPGRGGADLRHAGDRAGAARQAGDPGTGAERRRRRHVGHDERAGRRARVAGPGDLGDAAGRLRAGLRHGDRRGPGLDDRPAEGH